MVMLLLARLWWLFLSIVLLSIGIDDDLDERELTTRSRMTKAGVQGSSCKIENHPNFRKHVWCEGTFIIESKVSSGRWPVVEESPPCDGETNCSEACSCCRASLWWGWQNIMDKLWELHFMTLTVTNMTMALLMRNLSWVERKLNELVALASFVRVWTLQIREIMMIREGAEKTPPQAKRHELSLPVTF